MNSQPRYLGDNKPPVEKPLEKPKEEAEKTNPQVEQAQALAMKAQTSFRESIQTIAEPQDVGLSTSKEIDDAIPAFKSFTKFLELLQSSNYTRGAIISGDAGIGKTHKVLSEMASKGKDYALLNTYTTPLAFYEQLWKNNGKLIILDDITQLLYDKKIVAILKASLFNPTGQRLITYSSTSKILEERGIPPSFIFEGSIIIIVNEIPKTLKESFQALLSRVYTHKIELTLKEKINLVRIVFKRNTTMNSVETHVLLSFLESIVKFSNAHKYNVRVALKCAEIFKTNAYDLNECKDMFYSLMETDAKLRKFLLVEQEGTARGLPVEKRVEIFKQSTGYSRREYFNIKSRYYKSNYGEQSAISKEEEEIKSLIGLVGD